MAAHCGTSHLSVKDACIAWRRGLRSVWGLSPRTNSAMIPPLCGLLQLKVELACRCAGFITKCFHSVNQIVRSIATQGVYSQRMQSSIGQNAQYCATLFDVSICNIAAITKTMAWIRTEAQLSDTDYESSK